MWTIFNNIPLSVINSNFKLSSLCDWIMQLESLPPSLQTETSSDTLHIKLAAVVAHSGVLSQITNQRIQVRTRNRSRARELSNAVVAPSRQKENCKLVVGDSCGSATLVFLLESSRLTVGLSWKGPPSHVRRQTGRVFVFNRGHIKSL